MFADLNAFSDAVLVIVRVWSFLKALIVLYSLLRFFYDW